MQWECMIVIVYKGRHCNRKISHSSRAFAPHLSRVCAPHFGAQPHPAHAAALTLDSSFWICFLPPFMAICSASSRRCCRSLMVCHHGSISDGLLGFFLSIPAFLHSLLYFILQLRCITLQLLFLVQQAGVLCGKTKMFMIVCVAL